MLYRQNVLLGAALIVASELLFATMGAAVKLASATLNNEMIVFLRNATGLALMVPVVLHYGGLPVLATRVPQLHLLRAAAGVAAMYCFFYALGKLPLADGMLLKMTAPIFLPLIALVWLHELPGRLAVIAIPVGFAGVVLVLHPDAELSRASWIGLLGGLLAALAKVTVRRLTRTEPATRVVFYFAVLAMLISTVPLLREWQTPSWSDVALMVVVGAAGTGGQFLLTRGYAAAHAAHVGPFTYFSVIFAAAYGYLFWGETLSLRFVSGALLIGMAGVLAARAAGRQRQAPRPPLGTQPADERHTASGRAADRLSDAG
jgi:drug/metabolite transporter (DMT)-like permease